MRRRAFPKAMAELNAADAVRDKTAYESYVIAQLRAAVAQAVRQRARPRSAPTTR